MYKSQCVKIGLIVLVAVFAAAVAEPSVAGNEIPVDKAPFVVQIRYKHGQLRCAGALVSPMHVLTSAHCVHQMPLRYLIVVAGAGKKSDRGETRRIAKLSMPDEYKSSSLNMNIAVITLDKKLEQTLDIVPVALSSEPLEEGSRLSLQGWDSDDDNLRATAMSVVSREQCARDYAGAALKITESNVCTANSKDSCIASNGGPALRNGQLSAILLGCGNGENPNVFIDVALVRKFIDDALHH